MAMAQCGGKFFEALAGPTMIPYLLSLQDTREAVLLALLSLGEGGPGQANPVVLGHALRNLASIGLEKEARAIAVEAALAAGL